MGGGKTGKDHVQPGKEEPTSRRRLGLREERLRGRKIIVGNSPTACDRSWGAWGLVDTKAQRACAGLVFKDGNEAHSAGQLENARTLD